MAVSTLLHREPRIGPAVRTGVAWVAVHTSMLVLGVLAIGLLHVELSSDVLPYLEIPVAAALLGLGIWTLSVTVQRVRGLRRHQHDGVPHFHAGDHPHPHPLPRGRNAWQGYSIGLVHGFAGSGALVLLVAATLPSLFSSVLFALVFGFGSILGMGALTAALALPLIAARSRPLFINALTALSGALSVALAVLIAHEVLL